MPFGELDKHRVLAQHREAHIILGSFEAGRITRFDGHNELQVRYVHESIVDELRRWGFMSGYYHTTPVEPPLVVPPTYTPEQIEQDRKLLWLRWGGVYKGRVPMPGEYRAFEGLTCNHDQYPTEKLHWCGFLLCLGCKHYVRHPSQTAWHPLEELKE